MVYRKFVIVIVLCVALIAAKAQVSSIQQTDSASYALYLSGKWKQLIVYGNQSLNNGVDFPLLHLRIAYAYFVSSDFGGALGQYSKVLAADPENQTARYYSFLCNKYLNRDVEASANAGYLNSEWLSTTKLNPFGLIDAGIESSFKLTGTAYRGNGSYTRASVSNRLGWNLQMEQSLAYYNQPIYYKNIIKQNATDILATDDRQAAYYAKFSYALNGRLVMLGAYHYLNTKYKSATYQSNIGLLGLKFNGNYVTLQGDISAGNIVKSRSTQYDAALGIYPFGNLNLYAISRASVQQQNNAQTFIFNQSAGFKAFKNCWFEASATFGKLDNYLDADGLYVYDAIDVTKYRAGSSVFYQLATHLLLQLNYTFEKKTDNERNNDYNQQSITAGLQWKF